MKEGKFSRFFEEENHYTNEKEQTAEVVPVTKEVELANKEENLKESEEPEFAVEGFRWVVLFLYCLSAIFGGCLINTFIPITKTMLTVFDASLWEVYALNNMYLYSGALLNFPLLILVQRWGGRTSLTLGYVFMLVGSILKIFLYYGKSWAIVGQVFCVIGYEWLHPIIGGINCFWFPASARVTVFGISNIAYNLGNVFGFLIPILFVTEDHKSVEENKMEVVYLHIFLAALVLFGFLLHLFLYRDKPKKPLSQASLVVRYDFITSLKSLIRNKNFILVSLGMAALLSVQFARYNNFYLMAKPFGFTQNQAGYLVSIESWAEIFGLLIISYAGDHWVKPKTLLNWVPAILLVSLGGTIGIYYLSNFTLSAIMAFFMGMAINNFPPLCEHYTVAVTFPIHENITIGTIFTGGLMGGWATGAIVTSILQNYGEDTFIKVTYPLFFLLTIASLIAFNCMEDIDTRAQYEKKENSSEKKAVEDKKE